jgi:uncharacterized membrane protein
MISKRMAVAATATAATGALVAAAAIRNREALSGHRVTLRSVTIDRPAAVIYRFWRDLPRLAGALDRPAAVEVVDETTSRWTVHGPLGRTLHWTAEITEDQPDRTLAWRVTDGVLPHEGRLQLTDAPGDRGTEVHVSLRYELPGGPVTAAVTTLTGDEPDQVLRTCLRRIKQLLECGLVVTTDGQPSGRGPVRERVTRFMQHKLVTGGRP